MNDLTLRAPTPAEVPRVRHLFRGASLPPQAQVLVAVRSRPVERFVAAIAGWTEGEFARFQWACQPGVARDAVAKRLIDEAAATARAAGVRKLLYAELLTETDERSQLLRANGFEVLRSERFFRVASQEAAGRVTQMMEKYRAEIPANWHSESIRHQPPEAVLDLIGPYRLMPEEEVRRHWRASDGTGFEPDLSNILFEDQQAIGTLLARRVGDVLAYDIRVVNYPNARLRALANLCLFYHSSVKYDPSSPIHWLQFRGGEHEHRETANLAFRMGGSELPPRHAWARTL